LVFAGLVAVMVGALGGHAGALDTNAKEFYANDPSSGADFGGSVAMSTDATTLLIGSSHFNLAGQGAAYVKVWDGTTWKQQAKLTASDGGSLDVFGASVAISSQGNTAVVGAPGHTVNGNSWTGAAYVFSRTNGVWTLKAEFVGSTDGAQFGQSVAISSDGTRIVVGSPHDGTNDTGAVYFYVKGSTWPQAPTSTVTGPQTNDRFGYSVALSGNGNAVAVGEPRYSASADGSQPWVSKVAVYPASSSGLGSLSATLVDPTDTGGDDWGYGDSGLAFNAAGTELAVGAPDTSTYNGQSTSGVVYLYSNTGSGWSSSAVFAPAAVAVAAYGESVALSADGTTLLVGAPVGRGGPNGGAAYEYTLNAWTWTLAQTFTGGDSGPGDGFGEAVSLAAGPSTPLVGAPGHTPGPTLVDFGNGAAYLFK
jgi:hypothetical protein